MGLTPPVPQQDSDWEIRVAVLLSLLLQMILIFVGPVRKRSSAQFPRFAVWVCYLLADWVADLALGLLLNNLGNIGGGDGGGGSQVQAPQHYTSGLKRGPGGGGGGTAGTGSGQSSSPMIFAFWTPFLLLHLGGPDTITAYSLEDNELWHRHLIGLLFELFSALVIFGCSIKGNPSVAATVLIFVVGIIKYGERTYSLYSGSVDGFRETIIGDPDAGPNYAKLMTEFDAKEKAGLAVEIVIADGEAKKAHDALEEGRQVVPEGLEAQAFHFFSIFKALFVNLILSFRERKQSQRHFLHDKEMTATIAFKVIEVELNFIYDMVYTKTPIAFTSYGCGLRFVGSACLIAAVAIFFFLDKAAYTIQPMDVGISYALLLGGLALDAVALAMLLSSNRMLVEVEKAGSVLVRWLRWPVRWLRRLKKAVLIGWLRRGWSEKTSQLNLISYCLLKPDPYQTPARRWCPWLAWPRVTKAVAKLVGGKGRVRDILDDYIFIRREPLIIREKEPLLLRTVFGWLKQRAKDAKVDSYKEMQTICSLRGMGVLEDHMDDMKRRLREHADVAEAEEGTTPEEKLKVVLDSVRDREFDEALLLWHIATDLCRSSLRVAAGPQGPVVADHSTNAQTLSEYMLYLLIKQPEMLSATAGIGLLRYRDTVEEARRFFGSMDAWDPDHEDARRMLLSVNTSKKPSLVKGDRSKSVLFDAVILAKALRDLHEDELMWEVVAGVWWEMLTYAAGKCRGSTHVRQLSRGGEFITMVWFLMAHMGLGDMYQIQEGDAKAKLIVHDQ